MITNLEIIFYLSFCCIFIFFAIVINWHYIISHYEPAILLSLFFWFCGLTILSYLIQIAILYDLSVLLTHIFLIAAINMLFLFIFSFRGNIFNRPNLIHLCFTMLFFGIRITQYVYLSSQEFDPYPLFSIHIVLYLICSIVPMLFQVYQYYHVINSSDPRKKGFFIALLLGLFVVVGTILTIQTNNDWWLFIPICICISFMGFLYISNPHLLFLSNARVDQIIFLNGISGINLLKIGAEDVSSEILFGSFLIQKDISGAKVLPVELLFHDKCILIEHKTEWDEKRSKTFLLIGLVIADSPLGSFRRSLKYAMDRFVAQYWNDFKENPNLISNFEYFLPELMQIFQYTLNDKKIPFKVPPTKSQIITKFKTNREFTVLSFLGLVSLLCSTVIYLWGETNFTNCPYAYSLYSNFLLNLWALLAAVNSFRALSYLDSNTKRNWIWIAIGLTFWAIASLLWAFFQIYAKIDVPYPSIADYFWLLGYLPLFIGIYHYQITLKQSLPPNAIIQVTFFSIVAFFLTFIFLLYPILQTPIDEDFTLLQKLVSLFYPILDLILLPAIFTLYLKKRGQLKSSVWLLITIGMFFMIVLDILWSYMDWNGMITQWTFLDLIEMTSSIFLTLGAVYQFMEKKEPI